MIVIVAISQSKEVENKTEDAEEKRPVVVSHNLVQVRRLKYHLARRIPLYLMFSNLGINVIC